MGTATDKKKLLKELETELKRLQAELVEANKREGIDDYISVKTQISQAHFERVRQGGGANKAYGRFYLQIDIRAKSETVFIPTSLASGRKVAGFMYQIEGTAEGSVQNSNIKVKGVEVSQVTLGTLRFAKVLPGKTAKFEIQVTIKGGFNQVYKLVFTRINYKLNLADLRYRQYLKAITSKSVKFA